jgi:hypothetical protein
MSAREGGAGWLGQPKAEAQWRVVAVTQWKGKREWAGRVGRRGGPWLGRMRSWGRIQNEILFEFQLILEFGRTMENYTRRFRRNFTWGFFLKSSRLSNYFRKLINKCFHLILFILNAT